MNAHLTNARLHYRKLETKFSNSSMELNGTITCNELIYTVPLDNGNSTQQMDEKFSYNGILLKYILILERMLF